MLKKLKKLVKSRWTWFTICLLGIFVVFSNVLIIETTKEKIYTDTEAIPKKDIALILGTSRYTVRGTTNLFFKYRINAAVSLYKQGRVKHIIVSGDNSLASYNEPREMRKALMALGIPENAITLDYAGFRTLDSVVRCKEIFGQSSVTIISQRFHLQRALFIARKYKMETVGLAAQDPPEKYSIKTHFREYFAKAKAVIDLYVINKKPKFLGKKESIQL